MTRTAAAPCPYCGIRLDDWTGVGVGRRPPADGDLTVCAYCRAVLVFVNGPLGLGLRRPTDAEAVAAGLNPLIVAVRAALARRS